MSSNFIDVLLENRTALSESVTARLSTSGAVHYRTLDGDVLQGRVDKLIDTFLKSVQKKPAIFLSYIKEVTEERISEGFFLHEIQTALQILEEKSWKLVIEHLPLEEQVRCLSQITGTIGTAKDHLAHIYLEHLEKAEMTTALLQRRLEEMSKGTDSGPVDEDVLPSAREA